MAETSRLPVDRGWAWVIVGGHFMNLFFMVGTAKSIGILLQEFHEYFQVPMAAATLVLSLTGIVYAFCAPASIMIAEHFSARSVVIWGGIIGFLGISLSSLLVSIAFVIVMFGFGFGIGNATIYGNGLILLGHYFKERRSLANGLALSGSSIGQFALPPLIQYFLETYSLGGTVLLLGALYFHVSFFGSLFRPPSFYEKKQNLTEEDFLQVSELTNISENGNVSKLDETDLFLKEDINNHSNHDDDYYQIANGSVSGMREISDLVKDRELQALLASTGSIYIGSVGSLQNICSGMDSSRVYKENPKGQKLKDVLKKMFDFSVTKNYICIFYMIVSFLGFFGHFNFVIFLPGYAISKGITKYDKAILVSICGIFDLVGRVFFGFIGDLNLIQRYKLKGLCLVFVGLNTFIFAFADRYWWIAIHSALYGFLGGGYVCLMGVVLIDLIGIQLMPKALAVILLVQGLGAAVGQPFLGWIKDSTGQYDIVIYVCGASCVLSGALLLCASIARRLEARRQKKVNTPSFPAEKEYIVDES